MKEEELRLEEVRIKPTNILVETLPYLGLVLTRLGSESELTNHIVLSLSTPMYHCLLVRSISWEMLQSFYNFRKTHSKNEFAHSR